MPNYRKMKFKERLFGREADTPEMVVYKNMTVKEWFLGKDQDRGLRILNAIQRSVGIIGSIVILACIMYLVWE